MAGEVTEAERDQYETAVRDALKQPLWARLFAAYCNWMQGKSNSESDPSKLSAPFLAAALAAFPPADAPTAPVKELPDFSGDPEHAQLAAQVGELRRGSQAFQQAWIAYVMQHGGGTRDARRHDAEFLRAAIAACKETSEPAYMREGKEELVTRVKSAQRDAQWKQSWIQFTTQYGNNTRDPNRHDEEFLRSALSSLGEPSELHIQRGSGYTAMVPTASAIPRITVAPVNPVREPVRVAPQLTAMPTRVAPRQVPTAAPAPQLQHAASPRGYATGPPPGSDPAQAALAAQVKQLQKSDPAFKETWIAYVDQYGGGTRDPTRHDAALLQSALEHYGAGAAAVTGTPLVPPPTAAGAAALYGGRGAGGGVAAAPVATADTAGLVERCKVGRRDSEDFKQRWFYYVEKYGGNTKDPARHSADFLETALLYCEQGQEQAPPGGVQVPQRYHPYNRI